MSEDEQVFLVGLRMNSVEHVVLQKVQTYTTTLAVHNKGSNTMGLVILQPLCLTLTSKA